MNLVVDRRQTELGESEHASEIANKKMYKMRYFLHVVGLFFALAHFYAKFSESLQCTLYSNWQQIYNAFRLYTLVILFGWSAFRSFCLLPALWPETKEKCTHTHTRAAHTSHRRKSNAKIVDMITVLVPIWNVHST